MEFFNFSSQEKKKIQKALRFITQEELDIFSLPTDLPVIRTENFQSECEEFIDPERILGTENDRGVVIFPNNRTAKHKIILNKELIQGISYVYSLSKELIHLYNFLRFFKDHGHLYTFNQDKLIQTYYFEFLLWTKFQARKISTRTYLLMNWHETHGEESPKDGHYTFSGINIQTTPVLNRLEQLTKTTDSPALRENLWELFNDLASYLGELAFYQNQPAPSSIDEDYPVQILDQWLGEKNVLRMYGLLLSCQKYDDFTTIQQGLRACILNMEEHCKNCFEAMVTS
ncbi:hypothetical protein [Desulfogranum japonicum]|uniref:hypothetical protein n=1 Tax=Desulfogranum japonicum TaxID=231447 RepID=UPI0003F85D9A|nr:hypothetical protein [Desulfogranum japonicum]